MREDAAIQSEAGKEEIHATNPVVETVKELVSARARK